MSMIRIDFSYIFLVFDTPANKLKRMKREKKHFILLSMNAGVLVQVLYAVHALGSSDCTVVIPRGTRSFHLTNMTSACIHADFFGMDDDDLVAEINSLAIDKPGLTVIPCDCPAERLMNRIGHRLHAVLIPIPDIGMLDCFENKWHFYHFCKRHGLLVPTTRLFASKHELDFAAAARELGLPFVIKPVDQAGSVGVHLISSEQDYRQKILDDEGYRFSPLLAQQYIQGSDISLNLLAIHGKITAMGVQQRDAPQNFGAPIEFIENPALESAAHAICGISTYHGVMNLGARVEEASGRVFLIESNPRFSGSLSASVWCGLNFVQACLEPQPPGMRTLRSGRASVHYHPLVRPALWVQALCSKHAHRKRMLGAMMSDLWTFQVQFRSMLQKMQKLLRPMPKNG
jgi:predicted ATP-grasp superfamily ATP-dependent carboligase